MDVVRRIAETCETPPRHLPPRGPRSYPPSARQGDDHHHHHHHHMRTAYLLLGMLRLCVFSFFPPRFIQQSYSPFFCLVHLPSFYIFFFVSEVRPVRGGLTSVMDEVRGYPSCPTSLPPPPTPLTKSPRSRPPRRHRRRRVSMSFP